MSVTWSSNDVPAVAPADMLAALRLWLREIHKGPVAVTSGQPISSQQSLERRVVDMLAHDTSTALAVVLRLRCLIAVLSWRRFEPRVRAGDDRWIASAAAAAAGLRVNAEIGFSPVRLAWAVGAVEASRQAAPERVSVAA